MLALTLSRFEREFGPAQEHTQKVSRWNLAPWLDVIVQQDVGVNFAHAWLTNSSTAASLLPTAEVVPEGVGRHSNTYWRSMDHTRSALSIRVANEIQLNLLISALQSLREGNQNESAEVSA